MAAQIETRRTSFKSRGARTQSIAIRFTLAEEQEMLKRAEATGQNLREWARDLLLRGAVADNRGQMEMHIFIELIGIQMLLMGTLEPLLRGGSMTTEQVDALFRQVQTTKAAKAQELLARRSQKQEK